MALNQVGLERLNTATTKKIGTNKNLIINGAMQVAQRGTSASVTGGYLTLDRFETATGGVDEAPTQAQVDVASGTTPYTLGFRKALKVTNGNQTSGAGTSDNIIALRYHAEAQDIANSGWNYTSSSSNLTLQFWIKSSVAQSFQGVLVSDDGTKQIYPFATGSLSADTWTKITKTISGNSNLTFNNDNGKGLTLEIIGFSGSDFATDSATINAWQARTSGNQFGRASTSTWYTTNDATLEITGLQLEVGSVATDFEHRSFGQELALCQRYYYRWTADATDAYAWMGMSYSTTTCFGIVQKLPVTMRATPTSSVVGTYTPFGSDGSSSGHADFSSTTMNKNNKDQLGTNGWGGANGIQEGGRPVIVRASATTDYIDASAEL
tara:strand:- start:98 stop:1237 length:1140 start_codon:yes stop_codon:yes gene_type:complete